MGAITAQHSTQSCANSTEILPFGPSVSTKSCVIVSGEQHTGSLAFHGALQSCLHTGGWVAWLLDGSCMSREAHVQFCESLGVRFPGATHPMLESRICMVDGAGRILRAAEFARRQ